MKIGEFITIPTGPFAGQLGEVEQILAKTVKVRIGNMNVEVQRDMLTAIEQAEEETEAIARRPHKERDEEERPKDRRPRNRNTSVKTEHPQPEPAVTRTPAPVVTPAQPVTRVIDKEATNVVIIAKTNTAPARVEPLYCPTCPPDQQPKLRRKPTDIVCGDCYRIYSDEIAIIIAKGGKYQNVFEWVVAKAPATLKTLEAQFTAAQDQLKKLGEEIGKEVYSNLKKSANGQQVPKPIWDKSFRTQKDALWKSRGGNVEYAKMKGLESRIALLKNILKKAEEPAKPAPAAEVDAAAKAAEVAAEKTGTEDKGKTGPVKTARVRKTTTTVKKKAGSK